MAKAQFNCRLDEDIAKWIAEESERQSEARGAKFSQADVVSLLVNEEQNAHEVAAVSPPPKLSKKARMIAELESIDPVGAAREDVELGNFELPRGGSVSQGVSQGATGPNMSDGRGKASVETWRAGRKPIPKPGGKK